jgi:hypothetical protein
METLFATLAAASLETKENMIFLGRGVYDQGM